MAIAASEVVEKVLSNNEIDRTKSTHIYILGTDAMTGPGGGVEAIAQGKLDASVTYASRGDLVIATAAKILHGEPYLRDTVLPTMLVDQPTAETMQLMSREIAHNVATITALQKRITTLWNASRMQKAVLYTALACLIVLITLLLVLLSDVRYRRHVRLERAESARIVAKQQQQLEHITAELERTKASISAEEQFMQRLQNHIEKHLGDSELSIEMLSEELGISRTQLFRKTKALTGISPIELIRHVRLRKAQQLLRKTDSTIQQVAYEVGFTSPSYFSKCYKEFFGINPSNEHTIVEND